MSLNSCLYLCLPFRHIVLLFRYLSLHVQTKINKVGGCKLRVKY